LNFDVPISGAFREICTTFVNELKSILMVLFKLLQKRWKWIETGCHESMNVVVFEKDHLVD
jgi:hypothetical protein